MSLETPRFRYRLARHDLPLLRSPTGPEGVVDACGWIGRGLLWVAGWLTGGPTERVDIRFRVADADDVGGEASVSCLRWSRRDLESFDGASAIALALPLPATLEPRRLRLHVRIDGRWYRWSRRRGVGVAPDLLPFLDEILAFTPQPVLHEVERFLDQAGERLAVPADDPVYQRNLAALETLPREEPSSSSSSSSPTSPIVASGASSATSAEPAAPTNGRGGTPITMPRDASPVAWDAPPGEPLQSAAAEPREGRLGDALDESAPHTAAPGEPEIGSLDGAPEPSPAPAWPPLPPSYYGDPRAPFGLCLDRFLVLDDERVYLQGWCLDLERQVESFRLVPDEGEPVEVRERLVAAPRIDVIGVYSEEFGKLAEQDFGFLGVLPYRYSRRAPRPRFELRFRDGRTPLLASPGAPVLDPFVARHYVFFSLPDESRASVDYLEASIAEALEALRPRCIEAATEERWIELGTFDSTAESPTADSPEADSPEVSLLVPLGSFELVEPFLAILSDDPTLIERTEIVFALDDAHQALELERRLVDLAALYTLPPLRIVAVRERAGIAASLHAAASRAEGRRLLFLHDDVVPCEPGWLPRLLERKDELGADILGPRLLYEDSSIQSDGVRFERDATSHRLWRPLERSKGLPTALRTARDGGAREVHAVSDACLLIDRDLYDELGGLARAYAVGDCEGWDLCLRALAAGRSVWSCGEVELVHIEGQTKASGWGWARNPWTAFYNSWLLDQRHGTLLERLTADRRASHAAGEPAVEPAGEPLAALESERGAPAEILAEAGGRGLR